MDFNKFCVGRRGKNKVVTDYGISDFYKYYKKSTQFEKFSSKYSEDSSNLIADKETYYKIIKEYFKLLAEKLLTDPDGVTIKPLGNLYVGKKRMDFEQLASKPGGLKIDWKTSKEKGIIVYYLNEHRSYCAYRFSWTRPQSFGIARLYTFKATRQNKRTLAKRLINDLTLDFFEVR